jgi:hypothetical protein
VRVITNFYHNLMSSMMNKARSVRAYLVDHKEGITSWDAIQLFRATRLSAIIFNLRKEGFVIDSVPETSLEGAHYVRYVFKGLKRVE